MFVSGPRDAVITTLLQDMPHTYARRGAASRPTGPGSNCRQPLISCLPRWSATEPHGASRRCRPSRSTRTPSGGSAVGTFQTRRSCLLMSVYGGHSGKHLLAAGISHFDPLQKWTGRPITHELRAGGSAPAPRRQETHEPFAACIAWLEQRDERATQGARTRPVAVPGPPTQNHPLPDRKVSGQFRVQLSRQGGQPLFPWP
jgi:hypothetical protein